MSRGEWNEWMNEEMAGEDMKPLEKPWVSCVEVLQTRVMEMLPPEKKIQCSICVRDN
jgi:hypothetical protein